MPTPSVPAPADDVHRPALRPGGWAARVMWLMPLAASLVFVAAVSAWAQYWFSREAEERRQTLIADALSVRAQLRALLEVERSRTQTLAAQLHNTPPTAAALAANPEVQSGLRRLWIGVTWLDEQNRLVAEVPALDPQQPAAAIERWSGQSAHLSATYPATPAGDANTDVLPPPSPQGTVIVRYALPLLLKQAAPWWLTRKYVVQLLDQSDQIIASADDATVPAVAPDHESYRLPIEEDIPGAVLELTLRERTPRLWTPVPLVLAAGFIGLMVLATALLWRQMRQVSRAEAAWRTEATWRTAMQDSALVGLRARDAQGRLLYVNRTFCDIVGYPPEQLLGRTPPMPYWPPEAMEEVMQRTQRSLQGLAPREGFEAQWQRGDGRRITVMVYESPLVDAQGRQIGWMGSIIDITARRELEERERRQLEALARQARLSSFAEIASALAHQLNQPLAAIASYNAGVLHMLQEQGYHDPVVLQALQRQGEQTREAGRIVQRMRDFLTRRQPRREPVRLEQVIRQALGLLRHACQRQGVSVELRITPDLPHVLGDEVLLEQVLINLLRNALDAVERQPRPRIAVHVELDAERTRVVVAVHDNGPGLGGRSFEELSQPLCSSKPDGLGLGLAICRSVVEAHGGAFEACASPLGGAQLTFGLPLAHQAAQPAVHTA